jgi:FtsH-binding integral membrane protein
MSMDKQQVMLYLGLFAALNGLSLGSIFLVYTSASIVKTFFITASTFGAMSLYGYSTKKDLTA